MKTSTLEYLMEGREGVGEGRWGEGRGGGGGWKILENLITGVGGQIRFDTIK